MLINSTVYTVLKRTRLLYYFIFSLFWAFSLNGTTETHYSR